MTGIVGLWMMIGDLNENQFFFAHLKIKSLESELDIIHEGDELKEQQLRTDLRLHCARFESILRQKSRDTWLKEGDRNSKFFHISPMVRRSKNKIQVIQNGQDCICSDEGIKKYFLENFSKLYHSSFPTIPIEIEDLGDKVILDNENSLILRIPTLEEVK